MRSDRKLALAILAAAATYLLVDDLDTLVSLPEWRYISRVKPVEPIAKPKPKEGSP